MTPDHRGPLINKESIYNSWIHSYEEDDKNKRFYRPASYKFPPSRGRKHLKISRDGEVELYVIGETDAYKKISGHFQIKNENKLYIEFGNMTKIFTILSCNKDLLVIREDS
jgi:hypothetical protein